MARFSQETTIKASPEAVFDYVGATFASTAKQVGTQRESQTVTAYEAGKRFGFEAKGGLGLARHLRPGCL